MTILKYKSAWALLAILIAVGVALFADFRNFVNTPVSLPEGDLVYEISPGMTFDALTRDLESRGIVAEPFYWTLLAKLQHRTGSVKAGEYRIVAPATPAGLLDLFVDGKVEQYALTIPEGWTFAQVLAAVQAHPKIVPALEPGEDVMAALGRPDTHPEGWFYPDTYRFPAGTTDLAFLQRAHEAMQRRLEGEWEARSPDLPLDSAYEALILASIVEKETAVAGERPQIAAVFISRLRKGMLLQTDPTVIYGLGADYDGDIRYRDLRRDTPYNTYVHKGLTPTPIAIPGADAIHAVLHPADSSALFFVARGDGSHHFSDTYDAHREAVVRYQLGGNASRYREQED
ncbi:MAG: endolytic transglycosylase MltG [Pseudomonadota bacterium]|nr:endolytic transglycosylase MltG [Pseudomonadota bacterium]